jgi:2-dehydro-3-deoxygluconokinase
MMRVVCAGECMVELRENGPDSFARGYAGDVYNTAVYLKRSLPAAQVQLLTATGDDALSDAMRASWRLESIDETLAFRVSGGTPGLYMIETDAAGERRFHYWRRDSAARRWWALLAAHGESVLTGADILYLSGIALAILSPEDRILALSLLKGLKGQVGCIAFDPNVRPSLWANIAEARAVLRDALALCDIALPSADDLTWLFGVEQPDTQVKLLRELGVGEIALTLGANGALVASHEETVYIASPKPDQIIDTSGAGDAFNGAYLAERVRGHTSADAARRGLALAARVVAHRGALIPAALSHGETQTS